MSVANKTVSRARTSDAGRSMAPVIADAQLIETLRGELPQVSGLVVGAVIDSVPSYADAFSGPMGETIAGAVNAALTGFLHLLGSGRGAEAGTPLKPAIDGAYELGRGEAQSGRSMDALLAAYRIGAQVAWREMSRTAVAADLPGTELARFAELVFAYIDELSAASVAGHNDQVSTSGRVRERYLERLGRALADGAREPVLVAAAKRADWEPPDTMVAVTLSARHVRSVLPGLDPRTLEVVDDSATDPRQGRSVLLVPSAGTSTRAFLLRQLDGLGAVVGPERPWLEVAASCRRATRVEALVDVEAAGVVDTEAALADLVCTADPDALADLRAKALAPLADLRAGAADRLTETLRSWLLHQGRRDDVAADLVVHPQTVRYRMTQLRTLYGDALNDPNVIAELSIALIAPA